MRTWEQPHIPEVGDRWPQRDIELINRRAQPRISLDSFTDIYPKEEVARDKVLVREKKREHETSRLSETEHRNEKIGEALEVILQTAVNSFDWFGGGQVQARYIRSSEYDDYENGVDGVLEFRVTTRTGKTHRLALTIDASLTRRTELLQKKVSLSTKRLLGRPDAAIKGSVGIKYFSSQLEHFRGQLEHVVPVVIGIETRDCFDLVENVAQVFRLQEAAENSSTIRERLKDEVEKLRTHPAQVVFLHEIELQLRRYLQLLETPLAVAPTVKSEDIKIILGIISYIKKVKHLDGVQLGELEQDGVLTAIERIAGKQEPVAA